MSRYLIRLIEKAQGRSLQIRPRPSALFEPAGDEAREWFNHEAAPGNLPETRPRPHNRQPQPMVDRKTASRDAAPAQSAPPAAPSSRKQAPAPPPGEFNPESRLGVMHAGMPSGSRPASSKFSSSPEVADHEHPIPAQETSLKDIQQPSRQAGEKEHPPFHKQSLRLPENRNPKRVDAGPKPHAFENNHDQGSTAPGKKSIPTSRKPLVQQPRTELNTSPKELEGRPAAPVRPQPIITVETRPAAPHVSLFELKGPAQGRPTPLPTVHVHIGQVLVRAARTGPPPRPMAKKRAKSGLSLNDYLAERQQGHG